MSLFVCLPPSSFFPDWKGRTKHPPSLRAMGGQKRHTNNLPATRILNITNSKKAQAQERQKMFNGARCKNAALRLAEQSTLDTKNLYPLTFWFFCAISRGPRHHDRPDGWVRCSRCIIHMYRKKSLGAKLCACAFSQPHHTRNCQPFESCNKKKAPQRRETCRCLLSVNSIKLQRAQFSPVTWVSTQT